VCALLEELFCYVTRRYPVHVDFFILVDFYNWLQFGVCAELTRFLSLWTNYLFYLFILFYWVARKVIADF